MITYTRIANCAKCARPTGHTYTVNQTAKLFWCEDCQEPEPPSKIEQLSNNVKQMAADEGVTEVEIINQLLAGAAKMGHEEAITALLELRQPLIQPNIDAVLNRIVSE
jgi:peptide subunit release factor 1 (eRF1)